MRCNSSFPTYAALHMLDQRNGICRLLNSYSRVHVHTSEPVYPCPRLHSIYMNFGEDHVNYRKHFAHLMYSVIKQTSTKFLAIEYFSKRKEIRATMKSDLTRAFGQWGATVEAVQLRKVTIPRSKFSYLASWVTDVKPELTRSIVHLSLSVPFSHSYPPAPQFLLEFENIVVNKVVENQEAVYQTQNQKYISVLYDTKIIQAQAAGDVAYIINEAKATGDMTLAKRSAEALKIFQDNAVESRTALAKHLGLETKEQMLYYIWTKLLKSERMNGGTKSLAIGVGKRSGGQKFQQVMRPEVQEIRTLADYSNEVKQIVVSGADVHIITTSCYSGTTIGGEFRMTIGNSTTSTHREFASALQESLRELYRSKARQRPPLNEFLTQQKSRQYTTPTSPLLQPLRR